MWQLDRKEQKKKKTIGKVIFHFNLNHLNRDMTSSSSGYDFHKLKVKVIPFLRHFYSQKMTQKTKIHYLSLGTLTQVVKYKFPFLFDLTASEHKRKHLFWP